MTSQLNKDSRQIRGMFGSIAHRYDGLNRLLSLSQDRRWRRACASHLLALLPESPVVLDLCAGTGDLAIELSRTSRVVACDFCHPMLLLGRQKVVSCDGSEIIRFVEGDALQLPFPSEAFDGVTIAFGLRNLPDYLEGLREMYRVLRRGGTLAVLEFSQPRIPVLKQLYFFYCMRVLPQIGQRLSGEKGPYSYLPQSVLEFPDPETLMSLIQQAGFAAVRHERLTAGIVTLHLAQKTAN
ncbi:MAG: bifunctional demethylmenaquinone methyltransferase/2-methoxy-6-polyprenyl-1,4-benzoquinol methylase UbiE [Acidobacteriota bacterium]